MSRTFISRRGALFFWFRAIFKLKKGDKVATGKPKVETQSFAFEARYDRAYIYATPGLTPIHHYL